MHMNMKQTKNYIYEYQWMGQNTAVIQIFVYYLSRLLVKSTHLAVRVSYNYIYIASCPPILVVCVHT